MKKIIIALIALLMVCDIKAQTEHITADTKLPAHPRLLLMKGQEKSLRAKANNDPNWKAIHKSILQEADNILLLPVQEKRMEGRRMAVQGEDLRRMYFLGYAYRMTGQKKYAARAEKEMLCAAAFDNWNPVHFLCCATMTMALAIGYDWCYDALPAASRQIIYKAIIEKGIKPSMDEQYNWWVRSFINWNQVCNCGILFGALSVFDDDKEFCAPIVNRSINSIPLAMDEYAPEGAYPEGPGYWSYGTSHNVMLIDVLEKVFKTDFGLCAQPGFLQTGLYSQSLISPSLFQFNYCDNGSAASYNPYVLWFYHKTKDPALLYYQKTLYEQADFKSIGTTTTAIMSLLYGAANDIRLSEVAEPTSCLYAKQSRSSVAVMRSGWAPGNIFLGFKMGSPGVSHGHMDVGSFLLEADGVRWGIDLGGETYHRLESRGVSLWTGGQNDQRWDVYKYRTKSHSTLAFNDKQQIVNGVANLDDSGERDGVMYAMSDLSAVYADQLPGVKRAVSLVDKKYAVIQDQFTTNGQFTKVRWNMTSTADKMTTIDETTLLLEKDGKKLYLKVEAPFPVRFYNELAVPTNTYDTPLNGERFVGFEADLALNTTQEVKVYLMPGEQVSNAKAPYKF
ncbi:MAG: heparinase II/III family protein [Bacteroidales bacterium]|nr:heparinase II/III family protein [Bacteroidales bacterium]